LKTDDGEYETVDGSLTVTEEVGTFRTVNVLAYKSFLLDDD